MCIPQILILILFPTLPYMIQATYSTVSRTVTILLAESPGLDYSVLAPLLARAWGEGYQGCVCSPPPPVFGKSALKSAWWGGGGDNYQRMVSVGERYQRPYLFRLKANQKGN